MIYTTLNKIRKYRPCSDGWAKLLRHLGKTRADDEPLALTTILDSNGIDDVLWCLRAVDGHEQEIRLYAVWCARQVQHLMTDPRSVAALDVAERYATGQATDEELDAARAAARDAAWVAEMAAARDAARDAAWVAEMAAERAAAWAATWAAASAAAWVAEMAAASAAAWVAEMAAERAAARDAERAAQTAEFRRVFCCEEVEA